MLRVELSILCRGIIGPKRRKIITILLSSDKFTVVPFSFEFKVHFVLMRMRGKTRNLMRMRGKTRKLMRMRTMMKNSKMSVWDATIMRSISGLGL